MLNLKDLDIHNVMVLIYLIIKVTPKKSMRRCNFLTFSQRKIKKKVSSKNCYIQQQTKNLSTLSKCIQFSSNK